MCHGELVVILSLPKYVPLDRLRVTLLVCHGELVEPCRTMPKYEISLFKKCFLRQAQDDIFLASWRSTCHTELAEVWARLLRQAQGDTTSMSW